MVEINEVDDDKERNKRYDNKKNGLIDDEQFEDQYNILFDSTIDTNTLRQNTMKSIDLNIDKELAQSKTNIRINEEKEFLSNRKWDYLDDTKIKLINNKVDTIYKEMNKNQLKSLEKQIANCRLESVYQNSNPRETIYRIGILSSLDYLIETTYYSQKNSIKKMFADKEKLNPYLYKFRKVLGDGDCFYRGFIFYFLENIILTNNIILMKELLVLYDEKINKKNPLIKIKEYLKTIEKLNISIVSQILYIIIKSMESNDIHATYVIFLKIILYCKDFDYSLIYFTRYLLYEYISANENKIYSKENQIEIGCLLPEDFVECKGDKNEYFFENFYSLQLMKPKSFAEKLVIYIAPFVFNCNLNILIYDYGENSFVQEKQFLSGRDKKIHINLIFRKAHYDIYYKKEYYEKFSNHLDALINFDEKIDFLNKNLEDLLKENNDEKNYEKIFNENSNENNNNLPKCLECKKTYNHKENVFGYCNDCLLSAIKTQILSNYLNLIQNVEKYGLEEDEIITTLRKQKCSISFFKDITLNEAISNSGISFKEIFLEIRKTICLHCEKSLEKDCYIILPCQCQICSKECFVKYCKKISKKMQLYESQNHDIFFSSLNCFCGFSYDLNAINYMIKELEKRKLSDQAEMYQEFIKLYCKWMCMVCRENFNRTQEYFRLYFKDDKMDKKLLKKTDNKHLICYSCAYTNKINEIKIIKCFFCNSNHTITEFKRVDSDNKTESDCIII